MRAVVCLLVFACASNLALGARIKRKRQATPAALVEANDTVVRSSHTPLYPAFVHTEFTQQFEVKEDNAMGMTWLKKYKFELEEYEMKGDYGQKKEIDVDRKIPMKVEPNIMTVHGRMSVVIGDKKFNLVKAHMTGTNPFGHYSWRVVPDGEDDNVLFTIQRRKWNDHCKIIGLFKCKAVWKIYDGHRGDKSGLIYYGVGDAGDQDEPEFKFYHNEGEYKENKKKWVAKVEHKKRDKSDREDKYKVKVKPNEDAALLLLSVACLDHVADNVRDPEEDHH